VLEAAERLGIEIPTLCHVSGLEPSTSCFVCVVQVEGQNRFVPACATPVNEGMVVTSDAEAVLAARRMAVELLLSDHTGDCVGPCSVACPAGLAIADFLHEIRAGRLARAAEIVRRDLVLPASLGHVCPGFCQRVCRRRDLDEAVAIRAMHRYVARAGMTPSVPPDSGKRVAVVGAGPTGLSAAWRLRQKGHAVTVFEARPEPGGMLRYDTPASQLPRDVLAGEVDVIRSSGVVFRLDWRLGRDGTLEGLCAQSDAVFLALGAKEGPEFVESKVDPKTLATSRPGVFAGGHMAGVPPHAVHAVAAGQLAAESIDHHVSGRPFDGLARPFNSRLGKLSEEELAAFHEGASASPRLAEDAAPDPTDEQAREEAGRCLVCDCAAKDDCRLREGATLCRAKQGAHRGERRPFTRELTHPAIVFESGKCIQCGLCVQVAEQAGEDMGLTLIERGFRVRPSAPLGRDWAAGLREAAVECARVCPTGAIALRSRD
jgi:glutamate synthase (NADPH) small chain